MLGMIASAPFFWLGIPCRCAPPAFNMLFRTVCACCAGFLFLGYPLSSGLQKLMHSISILWSIFGVCIISASWCAGAATWLAFVVVELGLTAVWSYTMSLGGMPIRLILLFTSSALSYYGKHQRWFDPLEEALGRRLSVAPARAEVQEVAPHQNATMEDEEEVDRADEIGAIICVFVVYLTVCGVVLLAAHQHGCLGQGAAAASSASGAPEPAASALGVAGLGFGGVVPEPKAAAQSADAQTAQGSFGTPGSSGPSSLHACLDHHPVPT